MKNDIKVSVVIPAFNVERYIEKCIKSCTNQKYENIEVIVVDDGSTDNTPKILDSIVTTDDRIKVLHKTNQGVSKARNDGIHLSTGKYITFVDGDDYVADDYVSYFMELFSITNADFCISKYCFFNKHQLQNEDNISIIDSSHAKALLLSPDIVVGSWNKFYKCDILKKNNIEFNSNLFYGEGLEFTIRYANVCNKICVGKRRVYYYRVDNITSATSNFNINKNVNGEKSLSIINGYINKKCNIEINAFNNHMALYYMNSLIAITSHYSKNYADYYLNWRKKMITYYYKILFVKGIGIKRKLKIFLCYLFPKVIADRECKKQETKVKNSV